MVGWCSMGTFNDPCCWHCETSAHCGRRRRSMEHMVRFVGPHCCGVNIASDYKTAKQNMQPALQVLAESGSSAKEADLWTRIQSSPVKTAKDLILKASLICLAAPGDVRIVRKGLLWSQDSLILSNFIVNFRNQPASHSFCGFLDLYNKIFITPKTADGGTDDACRIVWMNCSGGFP